MSWSYHKIGRAVKLAAVIQQQFTELQGCPKGRAEEAVKDVLGVVAARLCESLQGNPVVKIEAQGSAWNESGEARSQSCQFSFSTLGEFAE